jgi:hypothetical protein
MKILVMWFLKSEGGGKVQGDTAVERCQNKVRLFRRKVKG